MEEKKRKNWISSGMSYKRYILLYTAAFLVIFAGVMIVLGMNNKTLLWGHDSISQHFTTFKYSRSWIISLFKGDIINYSFGIGQGADVLTTLNSYGMTDPFTYVGIFFPEDKLLIAYHLMIALKIYTAGLFALLFMSNVFKEKKLSSIAGALMYTFTGYSFLTASMHPNFHTAVVYFPLLLLGVERLRTRDIKRTLIIAVFVLAVSDYYSLFIDTILVIIFTLIRVFLSKEKQISKKFKTILKIALVYIWGILGAALVLMPTAYAYINNPRTPGGSVDSSHILLFDPGYYFKLFFSLVPTTNYDLITTSSIGLSAMAIFSLVAFFFIYKGKKQKELKIFLAISIFGFISPIIGIVTNGVSYSCARWSFAAILVFSIMFVKVLDRLRYLKKSQLIIISSICIAYVCVGCLIASGFSESNIAAAVSMAVTIVFIVIIYNFSVLNNRKTKQLAFPIFGIVVIVINTILFSDPLISDYTLSLNDKSAYNTMYLDQRIGEARFIKDPTFWRASARRTDNEQLLFGVNAMSSWWSITDKVRSDYYATYELSGMEQNCTFIDLGETAILETLAAGKYYIANSNRSTKVPYGYELIKDNGNKSVYKNIYNLPLGYTFTHYITKNEFLKLTPVERLDAISKFAVIDDETASKTNLTHGKYINQNVREVPYKIVSTSNLKIEGNEIITESGGQLVIEYNGLPESENYVRIKGIKSVEDSSIRMSVDKTYARITRSPYRWNYERTGLTTFLGYSATGGKRFSIKFYDAGSISYDDIMVYSKNVSSYGDEVNELKKVSLTNVDVTSGHIYGRISSPDYRLLQIAIPYSKGWRAYIDGEETQLLKSDVYYMALPINAGEHTIELKYSTPYLKEGIITSSIVAGVTVVYIVIKKRFYKKRLR